MKAPSFVTRDLRVIRLLVRGPVEPAQPLVKKGSMTIKRQRVLLEQEAARRRARPRAIIARVRRFSASSLMVLAKAWVAACYLIGAMFIGTFIGGNEHARNILAVDEKPDTQVTIRTIEPSQPEPLGTPPQEDMSQRNEAKQAFADLAKERNPQSEQEWRWLAVEFAVANDYRHSFEVALKAYLVHGGTQDEFQLDYQRWIAEGSNPYLERI